MTKRAEYILKIFVCVIVLAITFFICLCNEKVLDLLGYSDFLDGKNAEFSITFFDVGQGDATLVKYKDFSILIDAGTSSSASNLCKNIKTINQSDQIDCFLLTHPDADHVGGGETVFKKFEVKTCYRPKILSKTETDIFRENYAVADTDEYNETILAMYNEVGLTQFFVEPKIVFNDEIFKFEIIYPFSDEDLDADDTNSYSAVTKITYKNTSFLLMADADASVEKRLARNYASIIDCDVLKVAHHGTNNGTVDEFLEAVSPRYAVISVGSVGLRAYNHANSEFKERIESQNVSILQTSIDGNIIFYDENNIKTYKSFPKIHNAVVITFGVMFCLIFWEIDFKKGKKHKKEQLISTN